MSDPSPEFLAHDRQNAIEPVYPTGEPVVERPRQRVRSARWGGIRHSPATYLLLAINVAVFVWMTHRGVDPRLPSPEDLVRFGANQPNLVLHEQWWRLVTAMFVHVGLIHLATNMWCLWNLGLLGEPLLGFFGMVSVYILTGAAGNLLSLANNVFLWGDLWQVGAGASGAVFGIAGILIILLSNRKLAENRGGRPGIPWSDLLALRKSVIQFAGLNLVIGLVTIKFGPIHIDNFAHLGGFLCGLALGVPLVPRMTSGRASYLVRQKMTFAGGALALSLFGYYISRLR
jgi:rhomboid protease GluP